MANSLYDFGMIGLGVMGRNLLLNVADHGFSVIGFDKDSEKTQATEQAATPGTTVKGVNELSEMVKSLKSPRKLMMLVPAGKPVDDVIESLIPLLEPGDVIMDGGNTHYTDTLRRANALKEQGIHFIGVGISGGEHGARTGPSIMPGGDKEAYAHLKPILESIAAKVGDSPCVAYLGKGGAGHFVKMVHNGIEYGIMELISEAYALMKYGAKLDNDQLHDIFARWNKEQPSFLLEITKDIFLQPDDKTGNRLLDMIDDRAGAKGTGKWTSQDALDLPVPVTVIDAAVAARNISSLQEERLDASKIYPVVPTNIPGDIDTFVSEVWDALQFATIMSYAQGLAMLQTASKELAMDIDMPEVVRVWRGGCIIRSTLLEDFFKAFTANPALVNILLDEGMASIVKTKVDGTRSVIAYAALNGIASPGFLAALSYFDAFRSARMSTNMVQAQRDYFGAHTYKRIDMPGTFHTEWQSH
ncbi:phosphogluconate dehydrogenase (NADP(+)-dependent, decarboxylating) [Chitinophaga caeni]|uniref:6-phosphogluconate dehydrogenase, decarboxylating n=1 Tax=Chitinophaga caeni TaxID=2029983 RepID=A0A291QPD0_9BACT|nr:NADP-dependent phosphogluconate dehydrogenase [Chitinophaga caeni]ATL45859.1 phosphogluconate dehydrogenase (NADP(+)-dependent, decarboxylating) [Chitinophaga caeni]